MQQALYNTAAIQAIQANQTQTNQPTTPMPAPQSAGVLRWVARKWDLVGVLALMGSSAAYGVFALAHVGL